MISADLEKQLTDILPNIKKYPASIQVHLLKYYLLYLLRDCSQEEVLSQCQCILQSLEVNNTSGRDLQNKKWQQILQLLDIDESESENETLNQIFQVLRDMEKKLIVLSGNIKQVDIDDSVCIPLPELLNQVCEQDKLLKASLEQSVETIITRMLDALDPEKAVRYMDQSIVRQGVEHKAALYDAMCEKFDQLLQYHQTGRMIKDFKHIYRSQLKQGQ